MGWAVSDTKDKQSKDETEGAFLEALYGDPLRAETMRTGRYLVLASAVCMTVVLFNVRLKSAGILQVEFDGNVDALPMLASLAVLLLFFSFLLRAATDLLRNQEASLLVTKYIQEQRIAASRRSAEDVDSEMSASHDESYGYEREPWWEAVSKVREATDKAVSKAEDRIGIRHFPRALRLLRKLLETIIPAAIGILTLVLSRASLISFFQALARYFES
jgi:hypothetical protein